MFFERGMTPLEMASDVTGHRFAVVEALNGVFGDPHIDLFADQLMGYAVIVEFDFNVIVNIDTGDFPFGIGIGAHGKRFESRFIKCFKQLFSAAGQLLERGVVECNQKLGNGVI